MTDFSTCTRLSCRNEVPGKMKVCPKCGGRMQTSGTVRVLGIVSVVCGVVITGLIGVVSAYMAGPLLHPGVAMAGGSTYTGTTQQAVLILGLFAMLMVFGLTAIASGTAMAVTGRRNLVLVIVTFVLAVVLVAIGGLTYRALSRPGSEALGKPDQTASYSSSSAPVSSAKPVQ